MSVSEPPGSARPVGPPAVLDLAVGVVLVVIGAVVLVASVGLGLRGDGGTLATGTVPAGCAVVLAMCGGSVVVRNARRLGRERPSREGRVPNLRPIVLVATICAAIAGVRYLGMYVSLSAMAFAILLLERCGATRAMVISAACGAGSWLLFGFALDVPAP